MLFVFCIKNRTQGKKKKIFFIYPFIFNMSYSETSAKRLGLISDIIAPINPINSHSLSLFFLLKLLRPKKKKKRLSSGGKTYRYKALTLETPFRQ